MKNEKSIWCKLGIHDWYVGNFSYPVWGRTERHCLTCDKKQYCEFIKNGSFKWVTFEIDSRNTNTDQTQEGKGNG